MVFTSLRHGNACTHDQVTEDLEAIVVAHVSECIAERRSIRRANTIGTLTLVELVEVFHCPNAMQHAIEITTHCISYQAITAGHAEIILHAHVEVTVGKTST